MDFRLPRRALLAMLAASAPAWAQLDDGADDRRSTATKLPPGARAERDLPYGPDPRQRLDVFIPAQTHRAPIVLMVHGGGWIIGDKANSGVAVGKVARWLPRGFVVVSANYRIDRARPDTLAQADDVAAALAFVQKRAGDWGADGSRVLLMGHSAGAHLAAMVAADPVFAERAGARPWLGTVALDSAAYDLVDLMERPHFRFYDKVFGPDRRHWEANSPYHRLRGTPHPMLLVCSEKRNDSCPAAQKFAAKARGAGAQVTLLPVDLNHGQINAKLGDDSDYTRRVEEFMRSVGLKF